MESIEIIVAVILLFKNWSTNLCENCKRVRIYTCKYITHSHSSKRSYIDYISGRSLNRLVSTFDPRWKHPIV